MLLTSASELVAWKCPLWYESYPAQSTTKSPMLIRIGYYVVLAAGLGVSFPTGTVHVSDLTSSSFLRLAAVASTSSSPSPATKL